MLSEPFQVVALLARFRRSWHPLPGRGSLASSVYGIPRATQDVDLVAEIALSHVEALTNAMANDFYVDSAMIRDAIRRRASFNVVHLPRCSRPMFLSLRGDSWSREEMSRARTEQYDTPEGKVTIQFASAEDPLLHKLVWYKVGNQVSDRQWGDVMGVLKVQAGSLDRDISWRWAHLLNVADLLDRATEQKPE